MNIFMDMINIIVTLHLVDIVMYYDNISEHKAHIKEVPCRLHTNRLFAHADKCNSMSLPVNTSDICCLPKASPWLLTKSRSSKIGPNPESQVCSILPQFLHLYHFFIYGYSKITIQLMHNTCKGSPWHF